MTLLDTIRALDAPYVVWLTQVEQFTALTLFSEEYRYTTAYWCSGFFVQRLPLTFGPAEIDTMLAGLP